MGKINWARVLGGGLLAGLIMNLGVFLLPEVLRAKEPWKEMLDFIRGVVGNADTGFLVGHTFIVGILMVWLYAAIRPRFGPGPKTALYAGLTAWFLWLFPLHYLFFGWKFMGSTLNLPQVVSGHWLQLAGGLVTVVLAALVGGWLYKEA
jgi:hypothetical protein